MKKTITKMFAVAGMVAATMLTSNAQVSVGLTGGLGLPMGDMASKDKMNIGNGFGGGITARYWLNEKMAVGLNASYFSFTPNDIPSGVTASMSVLPISAGFDYYFMEEGIKPFVGLELGMVNNSIKFSQTVSGVTAESTASKTGLLVAPVVGIAYGVTDAIDISLNAKYIYGMTDGKVDVKTTFNGNSTTISQDWYNTTYVGINLGVSYKIGN
jgi:opacity protein-like surface antigen